MAAKVCLLLALLSSSRRLCLLKCSDRDSLWREDCFIACRVTSRHRHLFDIAHASHAMPLALSSSWRPTSVGLRAVSRWLFSVRNNILHGQSGAAQCPSHESHMVVFLCVLATFTSEFVFSRQWHIHMMTSAIRAPSLQTVHVLNKGLSCVLCF